LPKSKFITLVLKENNKVTWKANLNDLKEKDLQSLLNIIDNIEGLGE